ncbi:hypothetical protein K438DRAFT_1927173 [Mycena galopus ATCC 62051]|nr:hypothetical protein K438DRAFT_1927173 [Mycena galopus ATCC 62051]
MTVLSLWPLEVSVVGEPASHFLSLCRPPPIPEVIDDSYPKPVTEGAMERSKRATQQIHRGQEGKGCQSTRNRRVQTRQIGVEKTGKFVVFHPGISGENDISQDIRAADARELIEFYALRRQRFVAWFQLTVGRSNVDKILQGAHAVVYGHAPETGEGEQRPERGRDLDSVSSGRRALSFANNGASTAVRSLQLGFGDTYYATYLALSGHRVQALGFKQPNVASDFC